jgi:hypothetical protein
MQSMAMPERIRGEGRMRRLDVLSGLFAAFLLPGCMVQIGWAGPSPSKSDVVGTWVAAEGVHAGNARIEFNDDGSLHVKDTPYAYLAGEADGSPPWPDFDPDETPLVSTSGAWRLTEPPGTPDWDMKPYWEIDLDIEPGSVLRRGVGTQIYYARRGETREMHLRFGDPDAPDRLVFSRRTSSGVSG